MSRLAAVLAACLVALPPCAAQAVAWTSAFSGTIAWESNVSNSDARADVADSFVLASRFDRFGRRTMPGDNALVGGLQADFRAVWDEPGLDDLTARPWIGFEHKFGLGAYAPIAGARIAALGRLGREGDRSGIGHAWALFYRQRFTPGLRSEVIVEDVRLEARGDVHAANGREGSLFLAYDASETWQFAGEVRWRDGDVVSFATPPRPDLRDAANVLVAGSFFGGRTAYSVRAHSVGTALILSRRTASGFVYSLRGEYRNTRRNLLEYRNRSLGLSVAKSF